MNLKDRPYSGLEQVRRLALAEGHRLLAEYERVALAINLIRDNRVQPYSSRESREVMLATLEAQSVLLLNNSSELMRAAEWLDHAGLAITNIHDGKGCAFCLHRYTTPAEG